MFDERVGVSATLSGSDCPPPSRDSRAPKHEVTEFFLICAIDVNGLFKRGVFIVSLASCAVIARAVTCIERSTGYHRATHVSLQTIHAQTDHQQSLLGNVAVLSICIYAYGLNHYTGTFETRDMNLHI